MICGCRVATTDGWAQIMRGAQVQPPHCDESKGDCGSKWAIVYFILFALTGAFVMMNLFIAVIMENFADSAMMPDEKLETVRIAVGSLGWFNFTRLRSKRSARAGHWLTPMIPIT